MKYQRSHFRVKAFLCLLAAAGLMVAAPALASKYYNFTYTYSNGDYYQGRGYLNQTSPDYVNYVTNYTKTWKDENKGDGIYKITSVATSADETKNGYVYVDKYYDKESNHIFDPVSMGLKAVGSKGLGSEYDYIQETGKASFKFGYDSRYTYIAEADVSCIYSFSYTFGNGDYYLGTVYAKPTYGYYFNNSTDYYKIQKIDENNQMGTYKITDMAGYYDHSKDGKVIISQYFNSENQQLYNPVYTYGLKYLGSEYGWIIKKYEAKFYFGNYNARNYEAEVGNSSRYKFTYSYGNGDNYNGFTYAPSGKGYFVDYKQTFEDENGQLGTYKITEAISGFDAARDGQVFVTGYYDSEGKKSLKPVGFISPEVKTPIDNGAIGVGLNYLGSEKDYVIRKNVPEYFFGYGLKNGAGVIYEADLVWVEYDFRYTYDNGDYYNGRVWARMDYGYKNGYTIAVTDENGSQGSYRIGLYTFLDDPSINNARMGQVWVDEYYDYEAKTVFERIVRPKLFIPVSQGDAVGYEYLGSEFDYIVQAGNPEFYFGGGYYEADVSCAYSFKFAYGNGDYYTGTVYAPAGYTNSESIQDEHGFTGNYSLKNVTAYVDSSRNGQVFVSRYYDAESNKIYTPVESNLVKGINFLGSEKGYVINKYTDFLFGKSGSKFYEADQAYRYTFKFTYGGKDYYTGSVYGSPNQYTLTYTSSRTDETGKIGTYTITGITPGYTLSRNGKVFVTKYYDAETGTTYTPIDSSLACGTTNLGSEMNYIIAKDNAVNRFGKYTDNKFYEADAGANIAYNYIFYYNNKSGDYYTGTVYRAANGYYYAGFTKSKTDENGQSGYYLITSGTSMGDDSSKNGQVVVNKYYNLENKTTYTPLNVTGINYLGTETGFVYQTTNLMYRFGYYGGKFYEADIN